MLSASAIELAAQAWPELTIDPGVFADFVERNVDSSTHLGEPALTDLFIACGCSSGDEAALALFEARYLDVVPAALAHMKLGADTVDEIRQRVREKLLVAKPGAAPKIEAYAGAGKLRGLIQVMSVRAAISLIRKNKGNRSGPDGLADLPDAGADPELAFMKRTYRAAFKRAFELALIELSSRERNFLRLHHFGGLTVEQVGDVYGVHRATATRWLATIRATLMSATRKGLGEELRIGADELDSVMALIESRLEVSVQRLLASRGDDEETEPPPPSGRDT